MNESGGLLVKDDPAWAAAHQHEYGIRTEKSCTGTSELARLYPSLRIHLELLDRPVDLLGEGFDIDVRIGGEYEPHLIVKRISANRRVLCAAPAYLERHGTPRSCRIWVNINAS